MGSPRVRHNWVTEDSTTQHLKNQWLYWDVIHIPHDSPTFEQLKVYTWMVFGMFTELCMHHHNDFRPPPPPPHSRPKEATHPLVVSLSYPKPLSPGNHWKTSCLTDLSLLGGWCKLGHITPGVFWLISLTYFMSSGFIHDVTCTLSLFLFN